jgi:hypothetical protein
MTLRFLPVIFLLAACSDHTAEEPRQLFGPSDDPNFVLYVSNQSFDIDPVDIEVRIDGNLAVEGDFLVGSQHSWHQFPFALPPGSHGLSAETAAGDVALSDIFEVASSARYAVLDFWYYPPGSGSEVTPPQFSLYYSDEPPQFQ